MITSVTLYIYQPRRHIHGMAFLTINELSSYITVDWRNNEGFQWKN